MTPKELFNKFKKVPAPSIMISFPACYPTDEELTNLIIGLGNTFKEYKKSNETPVDIDILNMDYVCPRATFSVPEEK